MSAHLLVDERRVRAAAGITLALGTVAFFEALLGRDYRPLRVVTVVFAVDFLLRVTAGLRRSPVGLLSGLLVRAMPAEPVSLRPKRFAWSLGLVMSVVMAAITNSGVTGWLPRSICLVCLTLMWLEAVLGLCLGCQVHRLLVTRGLLAPDPDLVCADGACAIPDVRLVPDALAEPDVRVVPAATDAAFSPGRPGRA
jgi:hypothetical protein